MKNKKSIKPLQILLVEDSASDAVLLQENILSSGATDISISVVQSLNEAKEHLKNNHPDAVLLDLTLPDSSGLNTVREARSIFPDLPIVVLTGVDDENMGVEAMRTGVQDYLVKGQTDGRTIIRVIRYSIERKNAEDAMLVSELRYRRLFEVSRDGILILDADSGQIIDVNPFIEDILGYSHEEFLDKKLWEIGLFKDIVESKEAFLKLQTRGYVRYENMPLETKDGRHIAVEFVSNVYTVDHTKVIQCNIRDITDRARAEEALRQSNEELNRFNRAAIGRELRIIELKKEVNAFCNSTGQPQRYPLNFEKENDNGKDETRIT